ncbi:MAG: HAD family hydrolase [Chloroflexota bacterium]|nr:HAD family hydrolase [Chloroflexota bacterium]
MTRKEIRIQAVTFDFWGTLYQNRDVEPIRLALLREGINHPGRHKLDEKLVPAYEYAHQLAHNRWRKEQRTTPAAERLDATLDYLGISVSPSVRAELARGLEETLLRRPPNPSPGVYRLLQALRELGVRIGLISDTGITPGRVLRQIMARDGLLPFFQHCTFSDEVGRAKPHPLPFRHTLEALKVEALAATHIGDLPGTDIVGAKGVGMRAVLFTGVTDPQEEVDLADGLLASYEDLETALRVLDGG